MKKILSSLERRALEQPAVLKALRPFRRVLLRCRVIASACLRRKLTPERFRALVQCEGTWSDYLAEVRRRKPRWLFQDFSDAVEGSDSPYHFSSHQKECIVAAADLACENQLEILGYGEIRFGAQIDWHSDPVSGGAWKRAHHRLLSVKLRPDKADARVVWELNRFHFLSLLGQALRLTDDEKYTRKFVELISDWIENNPCPYGINWVSPMEVAIRAVNWIVGLEYFKERTEIDDVFLERLLCRLYEHGRYLEGNIESVADITTNHTIANYLGLFFIGVLFPEFDRSERWRRIGSEGLWREALVQVRPDGVQYESSTYYHGFVTEMLLAAISLAKSNDIEVPGEVEDRVQRMVKFTADITKPDGTIPLVGDSDDGRLVRIAAVEEMSGEGLLNRANRSYKSYRTYKKAEPERSVSDGLEPQQQSTLFRDSGFAVMRDGDNYMFCCTEPPGTNGLGNHQHNDWLSFELVASGRTFLTDCGTFVYNSDPRERNRFRSTAAHNTVRVDRREIVDIPEEHIFALFGDPQAEVLRWGSNESFDLLEARHRGYRRLPSPIVHRRVFYFDKQTPFWVIDDWLEGEGRHDLEWFFHFDPEVDLVRRTDHFVARTKDGAANLTHGVRGLEFDSLTLGQTRVSRSYGAAQTAPMLHGVLNDAELPKRATFVFAPVPDTGSSIKIDTDTLYERYEGVIQVH